MKADEVRLARGDHVVHFYDADAELVDVVGGYLAASLRDGASVVVVATEPHRRAFASAMEAAGVETARAQSIGRLTMLDAQETLDLFMVDGLPDAERFFDSVGELVGRAVGESEARVYGEMVAVLWAAGNAVGAIALEALWNELAGRVPFALMCAYPSTFRDESGSSASIHHVCELHSAVTPDAGSECSVRSRTFDGTYQALSVARDFVAATLHEWEHDQLIDDAVLIVSELATNAVAHASSEFSVELSNRRAGIRLEVADLSARSPRLRHADVDGPGGRGLRIVEVISGSWGHRLVGGGKAVWANLRHRPAP